MVSEHSAHSTPQPFDIRTWLWRYTCLLLLMSMLWHRQAIYTNIYISILHVYAGESWNSFSYTGHTITHALSISFKNPVPYEYIKIFCFRMGSYHHKRTKSRRLYLPVPGCFMSKRTNSQPIQIRIQPQKKNILVSVKNLYFSMEIFWWSTYRICEKCMKKYYCEHKLFKAPVTQDGDHAATMATKGIHQIVVQSPNIINNINRPSVWLQ